MSRVAGRGTALRPARDDRDLPIRQHPLIREMAVGRVRRPGRHGAGLDPFGDHRRVTRRVGVRQQGERRGLARPMALGAAAIQDRGDVIRVGD